MQPSFVLKSALHPLPSPTQSLQMATSAYPQFNQRQPYALRMNQPPMPPHSGIDFLHPLEHPSQHRQHLLLQQRHLLFPIGHINPPPRTQPPLSPGPREHPLDHFPTRFHHRKRILLHPNRSHANHESSRQTAERRDTARSAPPVKGQDLS